MASNIAPAYLQGLAATEGSNQATDYMRYQNEISRQRAQIEARRHHNASLGQRAIRGLGGALKGGLMGAMSGNPFVAAGGAAAGFAGGALDDGNGGAGAQIGQNVGALGAMASMAAGKYLGGGPSPESAGVSFDPNQFQNSIGAGDMSPEEYQNYMKRMTGG